jgi:hypothetical protein
VTNLRVVHKNGIILIPIPTTTIGIIDPQNSHHHSDVCKFIFHESRAVSRGICMISSPRVKKAFVPKETIDPPIEKNLFHPHSLLDHSRISDANFRNHFPVLVIHFSKPFALDGS